MGDVDHADITINNTNAAAYLTSLNNQLTADSSAGAPQVHVIENFPHGYIEFTSPPRQTLTAAVSVANGGSSPATFLVTAVDGHRGGILVVNMEDPSKIPALAEPWFLGFHAHVEDLTST